ncbi:MAG: 2-deoxy-5-keto-D-gluconate 6-phosphate aldolase domain-containing protein, partial [Paracoccaceae bacterium]
KVLCFAHPDDDETMRGAQEATVQRLYTAARRNRLEFLLEVVPSKVGPVNVDTTAALIGRFYRIGICPDWGKLEPMNSDAGWQATCDSIRRHDRYCRGIVVLGLDAPREDLAACFASAARHDLVKGFAVGRTIFGDAARRWFKTEMSDTEAVTQMAARYRDLCNIWDVARKGAVA